MTDGTAGARRALTPEQRELVEKALPAGLRMVHALTHRYRALDPKDLRQIIAEALVEAAPAHDATRGVALEQFAWKRIVGAVIDGNKAESRWHPSRQLARVAGLEVAQSFATTTDPFSDDDDTRAALLARCRAVVGEIALMYTGAASRSEAQDAIETRDAIRALREACATVLDDEERRVVELHYWQGLPWERVAEQMGIGRSTVKRRGETAREKLAAALTARGVTAERR